VAAGMVDVKETHGAGKIAATCGLATRGGRVVRIMLWLMESPYTILLTGAFFAALCVFAWFQNGKKELLVALAVIAGITLAAYGLERWWITEEEAIQATIVQIGKDVASNDFNRMAPHFHSSAAEIREQARNEVGNYKFDSITIKRNWDIKLEPNHQPPKATVGFNAVAVVSIDSLGMKSQQVARYIEFMMYKDASDGKWKVAGYAHRSPIPGQRSAYDVEMRTTP
jgi:hypothetical protein